MTVLCISRCYCSSLSMCYESDYTLNLSLAFIVFSHIAVESSQSAFYYRKMADKNAKDLSWFGFFKVEFQVFATANDGQ